jgi:glutathione S-transferase
MFKTRAASVPADNRTTEGHPLRLFFAPRSPFSRKILVAAVELRINRRLLCTAIDPWTNVELRDSNPLGKVPTLVLPDGTSLFDSRVIVQYLSEVCGGKLIPLGKPRWNALQREALGDGLSEAVIRRFVERLGPESDRVNKVIGRQEAAINHALDWLEGEPGWMRAAIDVGHVSVACALEYLTVRSPEIGWDRGRPFLSEWFGLFRLRRAMRAAAAPDASVFRAVE